MGTSDFRRITVLRRQYSSLAFWAIDRKRYMSWFELETDQDEAETVTQLHPVLTVAESGQDDPENASVHEAA